jgi:acetyl-CoA C-acetyltransferase
LGIATDDPRPLTVTGGLGFAGGPVNNYPAHAIARMVEVLRTDPSGYGCTTALGWYISKHAAGIWSASPPAHGFRRADAPTSQARVDARPRREPAGLVSESVTVEATAVSVERDGSPSLGILTGLTADGRRALANTRDPDLLRSLITQAHEGTPMRITNDGATNTVA